MEYISLLETTENTRELGGINTIDGRVTKPNVFWRSDVQYYPSQRDKEILISKDITTILDIRTLKEVENKSSGFVNNRVMFNCTAGKDRTGVISALLLMLADVDNDDIAKNYELTRKYSVNRLKRVEEKYPNIDRDIIYPQKENMLEFIKLFKNKYGDIGKYLLHIGVLEGDIVKIKRKLV